MKQIDNIGDIKLTPKQFLVINKIKYYLGNVGIHYKIEKNNIIINNIDLFSILSEELNDGNSNFFDGIEYIMTEIIFLNKQNIILEFDKGEYIKIISNSNFKDYFKFLIKKILG